MSGIDNRQRQPDGGEAAADLPARLRLHEADESDGGPAAGGDLLGSSKLADFPVIKPVRPPRKRAAKKAAKRARAGAAAAGNAAGEEGGTEGVSAVDPGSASLAGAAGGKRGMPGAGGANDDLLGGGPAEDAALAGPLIEIPKDLARYGREEMISFCIQALYSPPSAASLDNPLCELRMGRTGPYAIFPAKQVLLSRLAKMLGTDEEDKPEAAATEETLRRVLSSLSQGQVLPNDADEI